MFGIKIPCFGYLLRLFHGLSLYHHKRTKHSAMTFQFANVTELNFGVTMHELCAAEGLATYIYANRAKESMFKTESEFATIIGIGTETNEDQDALYYAINVCQRLFPHQVKIIDECSLFI